ncbi:MAG TPA: extracellular solute-binding protein [Candidatus Limnocylindrales bacterium]|nr:extracellular solute-binding protein [Candidatus Limnocylindrales bacterium]
MSQAPESQAPESQAPESQAPSEGALRVLSLWGGSEREAFLNVLDAFTAETGIPYNFETQRTDYAGVLQSRISGGNAPDIAIIPGIGFLRRFAADQSLVPVSELGVDIASLGELYPQGFVDSGTVNGEVYGVPAKYNSKGTIWYRPDLFAAANVEVPTTWEEFKAALDALRDTPGALGLGAADDWTLTDWFESIYLRQAGPEAYDTLFSADGDWSDPTVQTAVDTMLEVLNENYVTGGVDAALGRGFVDGIAQAFSETPEAAIYYEGGFVGGIARGDVNPNLVIGETIDWFPFPSINNTADQTTFGGDVVGAFSNSAAAQAFMQFIITPEANTAWASTGAIVSPHKGVGTDAYPNELVVKEAEQLANAEAIRFDGSDLLPAGVAGESLGALLQRALRGETIDWADYQSRVQAGWEAE